MICRASAARRIQITTVALIASFLVHGVTLFGAAATLDLSGAAVVAPAGLSGPEKQAIRMLVEEVDKRTGVRWKVLAGWPRGAAPVIAVGPARLLKDFAGPLAEGLPSETAASQAEGYRIRVAPRIAATPAVLVIGNDARGVLFGVGHLLREMKMSRSKIELPKQLSITTAPRYPLRGHQLGYRPKTNSYDGWTPALWEQYIRDLAVFGTNAVELIPPRSDDAPDSPHFPLPQMEMMIKMSQLLDDYGLDVWIWYPALDRDYSDPQTVEFALKEWGAVFEKLPRIDAIFVPGGDPGHTQPKHLMALLEKQTRLLRRYHPRAQMWVSPQGFTQPWMDEFYAILRNEQPRWLGGIVFGPQIRVSLPELRANVPQQYPIRRYPDITHSVRCQYPVPDWDRAYALTEAREVINPRPFGQAVIFRALRDYAVGFITYSEGCNDDVNKIIWSSLGWDPEAQIADVLRQYSRYFLGQRYERDFSQGLLALERNWQGPLLANESVYTTLKQFQRMEKSAAPQDLLNYRFQMALYRAYYDAYQKKRLSYETALEKRAEEKLRMAQRSGSLAALDQAERILDRADTETIAPEWRARIFALAEALFKSIRMQLSVERYGAIAVGRGANLDTVDVPLNNRVWLRQRFAELRALPAESDRLAGIETVLHWTDPGPGGFYDDLGDPSRQPHLARGPGFEKDPGFLKSALAGFVHRPEWRLSWCDHADALFDLALRMRYANLDPKARYKVRIVYSGDNFAAAVRLLADEKIEVHPPVKKPSPVRPLEFPVPAAAIQDGELILTWYQEAGRGGSGRGCQVAEVWLIKRAD